MIYSGIWKETRHSRTDVFIVRASGPARTMSTSCHDSSKRKCRNCTFLRNVLAYYHSFIQQCHSARTERARAVRHETQHNGRAKPSLVKTCVVHVCPLLLRLFVLRRCAPAVASGTHGAARAFLSVSSWLTGRYLLENWTISRQRRADRLRGVLRFSLALLLPCFSSCMSQAVRFWVQAMRQMVYPCVKRRWCDVSLTPGRSGRIRIRRDYADVVGTMDIDTISVWRASRSNIA